MQPLITTAQWTLMAQGQQPLVKLEIELAPGNWMNITEFPAPGGKNYLKDMSFTSGGAKMTPDPIAGEFSAVIYNPGNIFHRRHPTSGCQGYFRAGRKVRISLGGNYPASGPWAGGIEYWQRIIGYMDEPTFSSDTFEVTIKGLDYMRRLSDMKFTQEIQGAYPGAGFTPIDNYWGSVKAISTTATAVTPGAELYNESDALDIVGDANNIANWTVIVGCGCGAGVDGIGAPPSANQMSIMKNAPAGPTSGYAENDSAPVAVTMGTQYRVSFYWRQVGALANPGRLILRIYASGAGGAFIAKSPNCTDPGLPYTQSTFYFTSTITGNIKLRVYVEGGGNSAVEFFVDNLSIRGLTIGANTPYQLPGGCTGIFYVELDNQDGAGFQSVWPGKQKGEGWYYDIPTRWFSFDKDKFINAPPPGVNNLNIWYYTAQQAQNVVADIIVKAYPTVYANRAAALIGMGGPASGVSIDRVRFKAGSTYLEAIKKLCERCNWRFYWDWNGNPKFVPAPSPGGIATFVPFLPQHITSPKLYQSTSEIWNRIVIEGEKVAELVGWAENMPSELKGEAFDNASMLTYGTRTKNIRNHLFQTKASIYAPVTGMCDILLAAYKDPKWYLDFETPYNATPLVIGDTIDVREQLDITLAFAIYLCLIRNQSVSLSNVTYICETNL